MRKPRLTDPLRRPLFRRLATTYAVNELGDWMGIIALSVLVFDQHRQRPGDGRPLPRHPLPPRPARRRSWSPGPSSRRRASRCRSSTAARRRPSAAWPCSPTNFSLAGVIVLAAVDGALALAGRSLTRAVVAALLEPAGELRAGNAMLNVAFTGGAAVGPGARRPGRRRLRRPDRAAARRRLLLRDRLDPAHRRAAAPGRARTRAACASGSAPASPTSASRPTLRRLLLAQGAAFVFFAAVIPIEVIYAKETLGAGDSGYGLLLASWGVGMVARQHRLRRGAPRPAPLPALLQHARRRRRLPRPGRRADPGARLRGLGRRRRRQRRPVGRGDQRRAGADRAGDAGAGDERARVDRRRDARRRVRRSAA